MKKASKVDYFASTSTCLNHFTSNGLPHLAYVKNHFIYFFKSPNRQAYC